MIDFHRTHILLRMLSTAGGMRQHISNKALKCRCLDGSTVALKICTACINSYM